jgi:hypothetical protein
LFILRICGPALFSGCVFPVSRSPKPARYKAGWRTRKKRAGRGRMGSAPAGVSGKVFSK